MKQILFLTLILAATMPLLAHAQNTPFQNPSLDSNCYFPQIGDPSEMDTIVGSVPNQELGGSLLKNLGPKPDGSFGNMLIGNISPSVVLAQVATGPHFNLHQMEEYLQKINPEPGPNRDGIANGFVFCHLRDTKHLDIFDGKIYWADDNGNYDSSRYTVLRENLPVNIPPGTFRRVGGGPLLPWYVTHLTSDTIDDIVVSDYTDNTDTFPPYRNYDTAYALLYRGGQQLYGKDTVYEDTSAYLFPVKAYVNDNLTCTQADFRGVGRDDLLIQNFDIISYYKNDPPFSLDKFVRAIASNDTFFAEGLLGMNSSNAVPPQLFSMPAIPKKIEDHSVDLLMVGYVDSGGAKPSVYIFRGGPDFGSHRLRLDSAVFVIPHPKFAFGSTWDDWAVFPPQDAGDMTGTGNHVLMVEARNDFGDQWWDNFYVTGKALDNKIDIWNSSVAAGGGDTLTANDDSLEDFLMARPGWPGIVGGSTGQGTLWLMYGSKQIPVHLNPEFADVKSIPQENGAGISFSPNPVTRGWSVATIIWPVSENGEYSIYDMLGRLVDHGSIQLYGGAEQQRIYFSGMSQGVYIYMIEGAHGSASTRFVKVSGASGTSGSSQPSIIQQMKDARDGRTNAAGLSSPSSEILR